MSADRKVLRKEARALLEGMARHDEAERVGALSDEELDRELAGKGLDPKAVRARGAAIAARLAAKAPVQAAPVSVIEIPLARRRWSLVAAAAIAAAVIAVFAVAGPAVVAHFHRDVIRPDEWSAPPKREPSAQIMAARWRDEAMKECEAGRWETCAAKLDQAKRLDPAGENDALVKQLRWLMQSERDDGSSRRFDSK